MGLLEILTGLASAKVLLRGTDTYYRKEREAEKREERRRAQEGARAYYKAVGRQRDAEDAFVAYQKLKKQFPQAHDKDLFMASFGIHGFSNEEAAVIVAASGESSEAPAVGDREPGR